MTLSFRSGRLSRLLASHAGRGVAIIIACLAILPAAQGAFADELDRYIGKYPSDEVAGRSFYELRSVKRNYQHEFGRRRWDRLRSQTTTTPIEAVADPVLGEVVLVRQCTQHDCPVQSAILLRKDGTVLATCFSTERKFDYLVEYLGAHRRRTHTEPRREPVGCGFGLEAPEAVARFRNVLTGLH